METRTLLQVVLLAAFIAFTDNALSQQNVVGFPRDQIALQLGALQMGYVRLGTKITPFKPTNMQKAANSLAQGRIALGSTNGWGTKNNNVRNAIRPTNYSEQLDAAVQAVMVFAATNKIYGKVTLRNGKKLDIVANMKAPPPSWLVPLPYAISAAAAGPQGPAGPMGAPGQQGPVGPAGAAGAKGDQGDVGPQGPIGLTGAKGDSGAPGVDGLAATIAISNVTTGAAGTPATVTNVGTSSAAVLNFTIPQGAKGDKGEPGDRGPAGAPGQQGPVGPAGATGAKGDQGDVGPQGPIGLTGAQGVPGAVGAQGPVGPAGADGKSVLNGTNTPNVSAGSLGDFFIDTNARLIYGPKTANGWGTGTSIVGPQGVKGDIGPAGISGGAGVGTNNTANGTYSWVGGGATNTADAPLATISGGRNNFNGGEGAFLGGGIENIIGAGATHSVIAGGNGNLISSGAATAFIGGGLLNLVESGQHTSIAGGYYNTARGDGATVSGGVENTAFGNDTFAAGVQAKATNVGSFVWSGTYGTDTVSTHDYSFTVRAPGGVRFISTYADSTTLTNGTNGVYLAPNSGAWASLSDSNAKTKITAIKPREILSKLATMPVTEWEYKADPNRRYIGPMAQDFHAAFGLGSDNKSITTLDSDGVIYAAIQGLVEELKNRDLKHAEDLAARDRMIEALRTKLQSVEQRLNSFPPAP